MSLPTTMNASAFASQITQTSHVDTSDARNSGVAFLKFSGNDGSFVFGADATEVNNNKAIVVASTLEHGWQLWANSVVQEDVSASILSPLPAEPEPMENGTDKRGNVKMEYANETRSCKLLLDVEGDGELVPCSLTSGTHGGRKAFNILIEQVKKQAMTNPSFLNPVITLDSDSYINKNYGNKEIHTPVFTVVDWANDELELASGVKAIESAPAEDEPPFETGGADDEPEAPKRRRRRTA